MHTLFILSIAYTVTVHKKTCIKNVECLVHHYPLYCKSFEGSGQNILTSKQWAVRTSHQAGDIPQLLRESYRTSSSS